MLKKTWRRTSTFQKALVLFTLVILFRILFSLTVGLIDDEAYHWSWSKELQLSYFDHPGMVAWLEAITTGLFGDTLLGVRLPSFLTYLGAVIVLWRLAWEMFDETTAHFTAFLMLFTPLWGIAGYVASPEPIFIFFFICAVWVFWQNAKPEDDRWSAKKTWAILGVLMGLGLNSKFPMALLAPGFGLYLLLSPGRRKDLLTPWPWVGIVIATVLCMPIFIWNSQVDWPGFKYQFHDRHAGDEFSMHRWGGWLAAQMLFMTPFVYVLQIGSLLYGALHLKDTRWRFLFSMALPTIALFAIQPMFADYKPHWSGPGLMLLAIGAGALWSQGWAWGEGFLIKPRSKIFTYGILLFILPINLLVYSTFAGPWLPKVYRAINPGKEWNTTWDLSNEFTGWQELGGYVSRRQREIHAESGKRPFVAALRYEITAQSYWGTLQKVYMLNTVRSHYTVMQEQTHDLKNLEGFDALVVTTEKYSADPMKYAQFDSCKPEELKTYRGSELARTFTVWVCRNFKGVIP